MVSRYFSLTLNLRLNIILYRSRQCCGSRMLIPDPNVFHSGSLFVPSRIRLKELRYFNPKKLFLSTQKYDSGFLSRIRIPDSGVKKAADPGSRFRIRNTGSSIKGSWESMKIMFVYNKAVLRFRGWCASRRWPARRWEWRYPCWAVWLSARRGQWSTAGLSSRYVAFLLPLLSVLKELCHNMDNLFKGLQN